MTAKKLRENQAIVVISGEHEGLEGHLISPYKMTTPEPFDGNRWKSVELTGATNTKVWLNTTQYYHKS